MAQPTGGIFRLIGGAWHLGRPRPGGRGIQHRSGLARAASLQHLDRQHLLHEAAIPWISRGQRRVHEGGPRAGQRNIESTRVN